MTSEYGAALTFAQSLLWWLWLNYESTYFIFISTLTTKF